MKSSLVYIELRSGKLLSTQKLSPKLQLMSIRHIAISNDSTLAVAMQYQGPQFHHYPLVGFQKGCKEIILGSAPEKVIYSMKNYCGSVAFDSSGELIAVSSTRGGIITFWDVKQKSFFSLLHIQDACGVAPGKNPASFLINNGLGQVFEHNPLTKKTDLLSTYKHTLWDNHLLMTYG